MKTEDVDEWSKTRKAFFSDGLVTTNAAIAMKNTVGGLTTKQRRDLQKAMPKHWLGELEQAADALLFVRDWFQRTPEQEADTLTKQKESRVVTTPAAPQRARGRRDNQAQPKA
jgi:hypothetical protein